MNFVVFIYGAATMGFFTAALFFTRFWVRTRDRLFAVFATAFTMMGIERIILLMLDQQDETRTFVYLIRLVAFVLIIFGIIDKNKAD